MYIASNIDLVQIDIKRGVEEYYLPKNVNWRERVIDKIVLALAPNSKQVLSPIDGQTPVIQHSQIKDLYFDLYAADDTQIARNLSFENLLHTNNHVLPINQKLSLNLTRMYFSTVPEIDGCILLYIYYGGKNTEDTIPAKQSVTVSFTLEGNSSISLQDIVDTYIYMQPQKVKGIYVWYWADNPVYLTLRYADNIHVLNNILSSLCRPPVNPDNGAESMQIHPLLLDSINIDMLNSFVQNGTNQRTRQVITFLY